MVAPHPIKEFDEEKEPKDRRCLFCPKSPPEYLKTDAMTWRNRNRLGWYSNALLHLESRVISRFYVCRTHFNRIGEAWEWAREGFKVSV